MKPTCTFYNNCLECPQYYRGKCHYEKSSGFLAGEIKLGVLFTLDRISASIKSRRWISNQEYYEIKRGN
jgi:hypothetical protein